MEDKSKYYQKAIEKNPHLTRIGQPWSRSEEDTLLKRISEGKSIEEISTEFQRAPGGIKARLKNHAISLILTGTSIQEASSITSLSEQALSQSMKSQKANVEKIMRQGKEHMSDTIDYIKQAQEQSHPTSKSNDIKELLLLTREIHKMLKDIICENIGSEQPQPQPQPQPSVLDYFKEPIPTKPKKIAVKTNKCLILDD